MKLEHQYDELSPKVTMEIRKDANLDEVVEAFKLFLMACSYHSDSVEKVFGSEK